MQADPYAADFSMRDSTFPEDYDEEKIQELYEAYMAMYEYYLDPTFETNYDYNNYWKLSYLNEWFERPLEIYTVFTCYFKCPECPLQLIPL